MNPLRRIVPLAVVLTIGALSAAHAQTAALPAPDPEKQKLIDRILAKVHPENGVLQATQRPAVEAMQKSMIALQTAHVTKERLDKTMKDISVDVQKYVDTATPIVTASAKKYTNQTVGPILAQNLSVDELRQLATFLESPAHEKFDKLVPQLETAIGQKVQADVAAEIDKDIKAMTEAVGTKLRIAATEK
ncbi:hypothetical protein [Scleromatobacter humisilvae]|uniref:DUF2059 domain-containing protein n=1 Tax=Scleromatobacter humisilvae TaxID=2897159 RepID=A0A9X2C014_9BURK|nr:hypothetical protein [Scleromatobacter humisilvae]MCK9687243.1 hypothetical protein [Scleromatobacter humisilvae]